jgi:TolB-like protein
VCLDATTEVAADVPESFKRVQWTRLLGGETPPAFARRVQWLLSPEPSPTSRLSASAVSTATPAISEKVGSFWRSRARLLGTVAVVVLAALAYFAADKLWLSKRGTTSSPAISAAPETATRATIGPAPPPPQSIAVLPFLDMSERHDQEYFSDGLSEELIDLLAKLPQLQVIARTSSFSFKGKSDDIPTIGRRLNVANILEGSVRKSVNRLRVTTQLIRADNGVHIWSDTYERDLKDVFDVQDEIAGAVVAALKVHLLPSQRPEVQRTQNTEAYSFYLQGRQFAKRATDDDWRRATEAYRKAIELDPNFAAAYAGLAVAQVWAAEKHDEELRAIPSAEKAVELAPDQVEGYVARAFVRQDVNWDWPGAMADLEKALRLAPGDSDAHSGYARLLLDLGSMKEGVAEASKAAELDPLSSVAWKRLAAFSLVNREFSAAHDANRRALELSPEDPRAQLQLGVLLLREGRFPEAIAAYHKVSIDVFRLVGLAMAEHSLGHTEESQQAFDELIAKYAADSPAQVAWVYAWRSERNKAFEWLERAYREHDGDITALKWSPFVDSLRGDPRFGAMLRKLKLPD